MFIWCSQDIVQTFKKLDRTVSETPIIKYALKQNQIKIVHIFRF